MRNVCSDCSWGRHAHRAIFLPTWYHIRRIYLSPDTDFSDSTITSRSMNEYCKGTCFPIPRRWFLACLETRLLPGLPQAAQQGEERCTMRSCPPISSDKASGMDKIVHSCLWKGGLAVGLSSCRRGPGRKLLMIPVPLSKADRAHLKSSQVSHSCFSSC